MKIPENKIDTVYSFGDRDVDIIASKKAGVNAIACLWGCYDQGKLLEANPDKILYGADEIFKMIEDNRKS